MKFEEHARIVFALLVAEVSEECHCWNQVVVTATGCSVYVFDELSSIGGVFECAVELGVLADENGFGEYVVFMGEG